MDVRSGYEHITTDIGVSPSQFDVALASIKPPGKKGKLNMYVLKKLGYDNSAIDNIDISKGYYLLDNNNNIPILFIDTTKKNGISLQQNMKLALKANMKYFIDKKVWVPLMGTGIGGLEFVDGYDTIIGVLKNYPNINFTIAIPDNNKGKEFISNFRVDNLKPNRPTILSVKPQENKSKKSKQNKNVEFDEQFKIHYYVRDVLNKKYNLDLKINIKRTDRDYTRDTYLSDDKSNVVVVFINKQKYLKPIKSKVEEKSSKDPLFERIIKDIEIDIDLLSSKNRVHRYFAFFDDSFENEDLDLDRDFWTDANKENVVFPITFDTINQLADENGIESSDYYDTDNTNGFTEGAKKEDLEEENITTTIAGLLSDADSGQDYLNIAEDINAFAKVMAAKSFKPPLAIALLGKWGSGKSFFMRKLKERIEELSEDTNDENPYFSGIAHVHFNAWSYMDTNLWAGIITRIFEGLQEYISNDTKAKDEKKEIEKTLNQKLNIAHEEIQELEYQKEKIDKNIKNLEDKKSEKEVELNDKINKIKQKSIKAVITQLDDSFQIHRKVEDALKNNNSFKKSKKRFGEIVPEEYWQNPTELYRKTKSAYTFIKAFFRGASWQSNLKWFFIIALLVVVIKLAMFFLPFLISDFDFSLSLKDWSVLTVFGGFIARNIQTYKELSPLISTFWKVKEDYESQKRDAIFKIEQEEKALKLEIENYKSEIELINTKITHAAQTKIDIDYRLENTLTTEALFHFIEKRSNSNDYKKHLGIVSVIRKDFEILSELFSGHIDEYSSSKESEESNKFKELFENPLERIVLYIDDLDRCSNDRVVEVLEAVNLLMAYPLFIVVVGVDPRWVSNALIKKHTLQFNNTDYDTIEPSGYLEKIFQVPFQLKSASDESVKHMLQSLAETAPSIAQPKEKKIIPDDPNSTINPKPDGKIGDVKSIELAGKADKPNIETNELEKEPKEVIETLKFSEKEIELLQSMSPILGANPRIIKRFVNIYRIIKAHEEFNYTSETAESEILDVMFLIAFPLGRYRKLTNLLEKYIQDDTANDLLEFIDPSSSSKPYPEINTDEKTKEELIYNQRASLFNLLNSKSIYKQLNQSKELLKKHYWFVKRFTFNIH